MQKFCKNGRLKFCISPIFRYKLLYMQMQHVQMWVRFGTCAKKRRKKSCFFWPLVFLSFLGGVAWNFISIFITNSIWLSKATIFSWFDNFGLQAKPRLADGPLQFLFVMKDESQGHSLRKMHLVQTCALHCTVHSLYEKDIYKYFYIALMNNSTTLMKKFNIKFELNAFENYLTIWERSQVS